MNSERKLKTTIPNLRLGKISMSLERVFRKKSAVFVVLIAVALLLSPALAVSAYDGHGSHADHYSNDNYNTPANHSYQLGTVCGDALAGSYSVSSFTGSSSFRGWGVSFTVSDMVLSGGASGTIASGSGSVSASGHGGKVLSATFSSMSGTYHIVGGSMHVEFTVTGLVLGGISLGSPSLPPVTMSCNTPDTSS